MWVWMRITIDNEDGLGPIDYTSVVLAEGPITIQRSLNTPTRCTAELLIGLNGFATPKRRALVTVLNSSGSAQFTGYLAVEPVAVYAGTGTGGPTYRVRLSAVSDDWILDKQGSGASAVTNGLAVGMNGTALIARLTQTVQSGQSTPGGVSSGLTVSTGGDPRAIGAFAIDPSANWSTNAGAVANATYSSYRVVSNVVSVSPAGGVTHTFTDADGTLNVAELSTANVRELANDVTLSGAEEAAAYVQEVFSGDGSTTVFELSRGIFRGTHQILQKDSFDEPTFDTSQWTASVSGGQLQLTSLGLTLSGGSGVGGQTSLTALNTVELGGFLLAELGGVVLAPGSDGILAGFYSGPGPVSGCFAGFRVRQSTSSTGGVTVIVPVVNGLEVGTVFTPTAGHRYTLRLRLYCVEVQRIPQLYYCMVDGQVTAFGSTTAVAAPVQLVFELLDEGASSNTPATVLYDAVSSGVPSSSGPALCSFSVVNTTGIYGSIASVQLTRPGSGWVVSTLPNGTQTTRLIGVAGQGVDCNLTYGSASGARAKLTFFAGRVPVPGERITVSYRTERRAVARIADVASFLAEQAISSSTQIPGVSRWLGKVEAPLARSSADCEAAAQAVLAMATARSAALAGTYTTFTPPQDIWPGDVLAITSSGQTTSFLIRSVVAKDTHSLPESVEYRVSFANDWASELADGLGLKLSESIAKDAWLPPQAASGPAQVCASLQTMAVVSLTGTAIQIDAGLDPSPGGGFEVRRRDWDFGMGVDAADLVLRSPVRSFSLPRAAQVEEFYIRMYDGNTPAAYSRFSSLLCVNWPLS